MKSVKLNNFISLAGRIMEFLTMPQACCPLSGESSYLTLPAQGPLSSIAGGCRRGRGDSPPSTAAYVITSRSLL